MNRLRYIVEYSAITLICSENYKKNGRIISISTNAYNNTMLKVTQLNNNAGFILLNNIKFLNIFDLAYLVCIH